MKIENRNTSTTLLAEKLNIKVPDKTIERLARFMEFHFEARYPEEVNKFHQKCTKEFTGDKMQEIKEVFEWLKEKL